ncbi:MAG TPA: RsmE family RNA methyltransferase [Cyclobacteriaceae bacterium]|nr:RsmE family RNA methyltransferase [Cyclobacteriaceae bacterium]
MQLFFQENISGNHVELDPEESKHLVRVLRKSPGDLVQVTDGRGGLFTCKIDDLSAKKTRLSVLEVERRPEDRHFIHLAIAPTKNQDRMEWMLEKITEIGFHEITFLITERTEKAYLKQERLEKKIVSACKQSLKTYKPNLNGPKDFEHFVNDTDFGDFEKFVAHSDTAQPQHLMELATTGTAYLILVGPEGDFSPSELALAREKNFRTCSLGHSRLRTETAGLLAVHTLSLLNL